MKKTKRILALLLAVVMVMALCACAAKPAEGGKQEEKPVDVKTPEVERPELPDAVEAGKNEGTEFEQITEVSDKKGGMMILQTWSDPININFYADYGSTGCALYWSCGPMLCTYKGGDLVPLLLDHWELSDDGLVWTMHIKENAGWSDGTPITVDDIIFSIEYFRQETFTDYIFQADTMYFSEAPVYAKVDDYTYTITTTVPYPTVFDFYAVNCFIIPEHIFKDVPAEEFHTTTVNSTPGQIVCGGPFKVTEYKVGEYVKCERNEYFWDEVYLDELYWRVAGDGNSMFTALQTGELDFSFLMGSKYQEAVDAGMQIVRTNGSSWSGFVLNTTDEILSDINIRKALEHIYDQKLYIEQALGGIGEEYYGLAHNMRYEDVDACVSYEHDVAKAKELIEASGWTMGTDGFYQKDGKTLEINFIGEADWDEYTAMILEAMFVDTGVKFTYSMYEASVLYDMQEKGEFQMCSMGASLGPDPANYYDSYLNNYLFGGYRSDTLDQAWIDGMSVADDAGRKTAYSVMQHELTDAAVWLPLPASWGYYAANQSCGLDEAQFTSNGMFVYFQKLYHIGE